MLVNAVMLSDRYISDRFLPDKAIDLVDEACAMVRTEIDSVPTELDTVTRRAMQLEIEEAALKMEQDDVTRSRLEELRKELADVKAESDALRSRWEAEKEALADVRRLREEIESVRAEIGQAERDYDLNRAAELRHGRLPDLEWQLSGTESSTGERDSLLLREVVTDDKVAEIVSRWSGVPVTRLFESEREKLLRLDETRHERVIGQDEAVDLVSDAVIRARAGIKDPGRPVGSSLFLRPTGVGKTELAKTLAQALFGSEENVIRIDMSEYMERHVVSRLIVAPPGYVGYDEGGQLTEAVRRKPYSVVLFDEVQKAHPEVFNSLLQVLDDGRLTDAQGRTVDFKNTVIIMTSNIGAHHLLEGVASDSEISPDARHSVEAERRAHFRPEFLNRLDEVIVFKSLSHNEIRKIFGLISGGLAQRLAEQDVEVAFESAALDHIAEQGFDPVFGARPLRRYFQRHVESQLARAIVAGGAAAGSRAIVSVSKGAGLTVRIEPPPEVRGAA